jgi:hypothetical protein
VQRAQVGGAGVSPAVLWRDAHAKIASGTLAPPSSRCAAIVWDHRSMYSDRGEKCGLVVRGFLAVVAKILVFFTGFNDVFFVPLLAKGFK